MSSVLLIFTHSKLLGGMPGNYTHSSELSRIFAKRIKTIESQMVANPKEASFELIFKDL